MGKYWVACYILKGPGSPWRGKKKLNIMLNFSENTEFLKKTDIFQNE